MGEGGPGGPGPSDQLGLEPQELEDLNTPEWDSAFEGASWFKKNVQIKATQVTEPTPVTTTLADGHQETTNTANPGDFIVTNPGGEQYVVGEEKFGSKYETIEDQPGVYQTKGAPLKAVKIDKDIKFNAPWGQEMTMRSGDWIVDAGNNDRYGIGAAEFADTYAPYTPEA